MLNPWIRFEAAKKMSGTDEKDRQFLIIGLDAAKDGDADLVKTVVGTIHYNSTREKLIEAVVPYISKTDALLLVDLCYYQSTKDRILKKILS